MKRPFDSSRARKVWALSWKRFLGVHVGLALFLSLVLSAWTGGSSVGFLGGSLLAWSSLYVRAAKALALAVILGFLLDARCSEDSWGDAALVYALAVSWILLIRHRLPQLPTQALIYTGALIELMVLVLLGMLQAHHCADQAVPWECLVVQGALALLWTTVACAPIGYLLDKLCNRRDDE